MCFAAYRGFFKSAWRKAREHCEGKEEEEGTSVFGVLAMGFYATTRCRMGTTLDDEK